MTSLIAYVGDEYYAAPPDTAVELRAPDGRATLTRFWPSGAVSSPGSIAFPMALLCDEPCSRITANVRQRFLV